FDGVCSPRSILLTCEKLIPVISDKARKDISFSSRYFLITAQLLITVDSNPEPAVLVTGVSVEPNTASLYVGGTLQLNATVTPDNATTPNVTWSSSNNNVAIVSETGLVTAVSPGFAIITAETVDGGFQA